MNRWRHFMKPPHKYSSQRAFLYLHQNPMQLPFKAKTPQDCQDWWIRQPAQECRVWQCFLWGLDWLDAMCLVHCIVGWQRMAFPRSRGMRSRITMVPWFHCHRQGLWIHILTMVVSISFHARFFFIFLDFSFGKHQKPRYYRGVRTVTDVEPCSKWCWTLKLTWNTPLIYLSCEKHPGCLGLVVLYEVVLPLASGLLLPFGIPFGMPIHKPVK